MAMGPSRAIYYVLLDFDNTAPWKVGQICQINSEDDITNYVYDACIKINVWLDIFPELGSIDPSSK